MASRRESKMFGEGVQLRFSQSFSDEQNNGSLVERIQIQKGAPVLDLSLCSIARAPISLIETYYGKVESLDLSFNHMRKLTPNFALRLSTLTKLNLSRNQLKRLPDNFGRLEQLEYLDIHRNELQTLPLTMGKMKRLQYLNLRENPFRFPLCELLETEHLLPVTEGVGSGNSADIVVGFLEKLLHESCLGRNDTFLPVDTDEEDNNNLQQTSNVTVTRRRAETSFQRQQVEETEIFLSDAQKRVFGIILMIVCLCVFPFVTAYFYDSNYLDEKLNQPGSTLMTIWEYYKPAHKSAEAFLDYFKVNDRPFYVKKPFSQEETSSFLYKFYKLITGKK